MENKTYDLEFRDALESHEDGCVRLVQTEEDKCLVKVQVFGRYYDMAEIEADIEEILDMHSWDVSTTDDGRHIVTFEYNDIEIVTTPYRKWHDADVVHVKWGLNSDDYGYITKSLAMFVRHKGEIIIIPCRRPELGVYTVEEA